MAKLVGTFASGHAPNIAKEWERALKPETQQWLEDHFGELSRRVNALEPDVIVLQSNDHWVNFFLDCIPAFCIGIGEEHDAPPEPFMKPFLNEPIPGHPGLATHFLDTALAAEFDPAFSHRCALDHGMGVPIWQTQFSTIPAVVPLFLNLVQKPFVSAQRCVKWGHMIRDAIESYPEDLRVVLMGAGGLSHSIGETTMGWIDEPFDHACIELFRNASEDKIAAELERMLPETGNGGAELLNWLVVHAAARGKDFDLIGYAPMPEILIGAAVAEWKLAA